MALKIIKSDVDGRTGHISVHLQVIEENQEGQHTMGPVEVHGIEHAVLMESYHGAEDPTDETMHEAMRRWLAEPHDRALCRKRAIDQASRTVANLKGKTLEFNS